ncbi:ROK family protein [Krasilnikoviella flava]|uniref:Predicted dehydrogenase n=1 Tax=Krasilnikoviella flava TaxID=526729 RepID=A0A1T5KC58_9MICO|nr:ROK family protein [Krasilnikoviella flava]SKC61200.1 Predicted dehydrogenase [Krasilnikoviella flava]
MVRTGPRGQDRHVTDVRRRNTLSCVEVLRGSPSTTLTALAKDTGLSRPTVESIVSELVEQGLAREVAVAEEGALGRPARHFAFAADARYVVGLDLGVHSVTGMVADLSGQVRAVVRRTVDGPVDGVARLEVARAVQRELLDAVDAPRSRLAAVAAAVPGIVDGARVRLSLPIPDWTGVNLAARLSTGGEHPVVIENDINMASLAEHALGAARLADDVVLVQLGHRVGAALVLGGQVYRGNRFAAGEVGDFSWTGWDGWCEGSLLGEIEQAGGAEAVALRAREGDAVALGLLQQYVRRVAPGVATLAMVVDPECVVLGGGLSRAGELLRAPLQTEVDRLVHPRAAAPLVTSAFASDGAALGALVRALEVGSQDVFGSEIAAPPLRAAGPATSLADALAAADEAPAPAAPDAGVGRGPGAEAQQGAGGVAQVREPLRVAVVGVGARARLAQWVGRTGVPAHVVRAVDVDPAGQDRARELFGPGTAFSTDHRDLSARGGTGEGVDAAFVCTPDDTHADVAEDLLRAGVAVYLEKPLATTTEDCDRVLAAAVETGTRLYVGHNMRHMAVVRTMRDVVARGEIGEVQAVWCRHFVGNGGDYYFKDWHAERARSTGLLLQKAVHDIDVIHWLAGSTTRDVVGMGDLQVYGRVTDRADRTGQLMTDWFSYDNWPPLEQRGLHPVIDVEDTSMMLMRLGNGVLASYEQCHFTPDYWRNYTVIGTRGRLENVGDGDGGSVRVWNRRTSWSERGDVEYPVVAAGQGHQDADRLTVDEFLRSVADGAPITTSPVMARDAVATGIAATLSLRAGSAPQRVRPVAPEVAAHFDDDVDPAARRPGT